ncbi:MAG TPA: PilZ domain-containing protein [Allosphingosinicella sp.]|nr:PilZ domain-containing protein [Allosphingosinicella sp.]
MIETKIEQSGAAAKTSRRTSSRDSLLLSATIRRTQDSDSDLKPVRVRNLSAIGLMADYVGLAMPGDAVIVTMRGIGPVSGKVAWLKRGQIGVTFDIEVDPLKARRQVGKPAPQRTKQRPL